MGAKGVATPGEEEAPWQEEEGKEKLNPRESSLFRTFAARANYLAADRADIQFATKEICKGMAEPRRRDMSKLRRLARYLIAHPGVVLEYRFQDACLELDGFSDSDWARCRRTAKSTSGGCIMRGRHCIKTWATTQRNIILSSGEAELVAAVKTSGEMIGLIQLAKASRWKGRCTWTRRQL